VRVSSGRSLSTPCRGRSHHHHLSRPSRRL